jgi:hypothetical protein
MDKPWRYAETRCRSLEGSKKLPMHGYALRQTVKFLGRTVGFEQIWC